jgi:hypothetical protein
MKSNTILKVSFGSLRNAFDLGPLDMPFACKCTCFAHETEAFSFRSKISNLECSIPLQANPNIELICLGALPLTPKPTLRENHCF